MPKRSTRRWDDWRCYRCMRWFSVDARRIEQDTPSGITVGVCLDCAKVAPRHHARYRALPWTRDGDR